MTSDLRFVSLGFGHIIQCNMVWAVIKVSTAQAQRLVKQAKKNGTYLDWRAGRACKSIVLCTNDRVIASPFSVVTVFNRLKRATTEFVSVDFQTEHILQKEWKKRDVSETEFDDEYLDDEEDTYEDDEDTEEDMTDAEYEDEEDELPDDD